MTLLLAHVRDLDEAVLASRAGADIVAFDADVALGSAHLREALGPDVQIGLHVAASAAASAQTADYLLCDPPWGSADAESGKRIGMRDTIGAGRAAVASATAARLHGLMIDTSAHGRLLEHAPLGDLAAFAEACRQVGLLTCFGGRLEAPDVPRLLRLRPDLLSFRGALRRNGQFDAAALTVIRELMPRRTAALTVASNAATDRVFVRDFIAHASIGAYGRERGAPQRVRFNVDVEVARIDHVARDMRDIFSYDLVLDAIRLILERGHVGLVETLADEVAAAVLQHGRVVRVAIQVEKLDMIDGALGVAITRTRADLAPSRAP